MPIAVGMHARRHVAERPEGELVGKALRRSEAARALPACAYELCANDSPRPFVERKVEDHVPELVEDDERLQRPRRCRSTPDPRAPPRRHRRPDSPGFLRRPLPHHRARPAASSAAAASGRQRSETPLAPTTLPSEKSSSVARTRKARPGSVPGGPVRAVPTWYARSYASDVFRPKATRREPPSPLATARG